jgi:hypothetical protein
MKAKLVRLKHELFGHPRNQVTWGTAVEGATCKCGAHMTYADFVV